MTPICDICFEICSANSALVSMVCSHTYHKDCLLEWFRQRLVCPKCITRDRFSQRRWIQIYLDERTDFEGIPRHEYREHQGLDTNDQESQRAQLRAASANNNNGHDDEWIGDDRNYVIRFFVWAFLFMCWNFYIVYQCAHCAENANAAATYE